MYVGQIKLSLEACLDGANGSSHGDVVLIVVYLRERIATGYALLQDGRVVQCAPNLLDRQRQRLLASKFHVLYLLSRRIHAFGRQSYGLHDFGVGGAPAEVACQVVLYLGIRWIWVGFKQLLAHQDKT